MADIEASHSETQRGAFEFNNVSFTVKGGKNILNGVSGRIEPGELLAIMGPSGAGKSTLLDALAGRSSGTVQGSITHSGHHKFDRKNLTSYVEQDDALIGVLSVRETLTIAARLGLPRSATKEMIKRDVDRILNQLGLQGVQDNMIGTPIQRGISGGQKRRVSIGQSLVTKPRILFLDEPTSGLDSATSKEVMTSIARSCKERGTVVIASIHQPAWDTLKLFDKLLLLSHGETVFNDRTDKLVGWLSSVGRPVDPYRNPGDAMMELINDDFSDGHQSIRSRLVARHKNEVALLLPIEWDSNEKALALVSGPRDDVVDHLRKTWILMERNALNYTRSLLSYGIRLGMYLGLGFLLATIWINLGQDATKINDRLSVFFFSVAFLSFMSVAGIPSFLEERSVFMRERNNGLYSPIHYVIANSIVNIPFLFICSLGFMLIMYWAIGLHPGAIYFWRFTAFLFLAIYAAESQCLIFAAFLPIFVAALALAAFANGFWMCTQGYFIRAVNLPRFWYYWAHWINYQTFAFNLISKSDLSGLTFPCKGSIADNTCQCPYPSSLIPQGICAVSGDDVLNELDIASSNYVLYGFIIVIIIVVYRAMFWLGLTLRKH